MLQAALRSRFHTIRWCAHDEDVFNNRQQRTGRGAEQLHNGTRDTMTIMRLPVARYPWLWSWSWPWPSGNAASRVTGQRFFAQCNAASSLRFRQKVVNVGLQSPLLVNAGTAASCLGVLHPWLHSRRSAAATTVPPVHPPPSDPEKDAGGDKNKQKLAHLVVPRTVGFFFTHSCICVCF